MKNFLSILFLVCILNVRSQTSYTFTEGYGFKFIPQTSTNPPVISFLPSTRTNGGSNGFKQPCNVFYPESSSTSSYPFVLSTAFADLMQVYGQTNSSSVLSMGVMNDDGIIALEALPGFSSQGVLKLNPGCSNNVEICQGGGHTTIFGSSQTNGNAVIGTGPFISPLTQLGINISPSNSSGGLSRAITIQNPALATSNKVVFDISGTGKTIIGNQINAGNSAMLNINVQGNSTTPAYALDIFDQYTGLVNFRVKSNGYTYAREINVQLTGFPDYVFNKNYKLESLESLESYILQNKHLPNVPTADEVMKDGANLGELSRIQIEKIEELTLYIIALKKELNVLKEKVLAK